MNPSTVNFSIVDRVAVLEINRPEKRNALSCAVLEETRKVISVVAGDSDVRALIVASAGSGVFCAGGDIAEMSKMSSDSGAAYIELGRSCASALEALRIPVIGAIHGHAFGGGLELAMACDILIASETALVGLPEITLGIIPGFGGVPRVVRRAGFARAQWMVLTGERIDSRTALGWGLFQRVAPPDSVRPESMALGHHFATLSANALASAKAALSAAYGVPLEVGLSAETKFFNQSFSHPDRIEGMRAFVERRKAAFS